MADDYQKIRDFEFGVLDKHHESLAFYQYTEDTVIPFLLQIYGDTERHRDSFIAKGHTETNIGTYLTNTMHGIGHCIRWIKQQKHPSKIEDATFTSHECQHLAADFLSWGTAYHMIAQEFVAWSRKIKPAQLDELKKEIVFLNPTGFDYSGIFEKQLLYAEQMQAVYLSYPHDEMESEFEDWIKDINFSKPPIANHIKWERGRTSISFPLLENKMGEILFPELPESTDFAGYNLRELRIFYALFFLNFHFIRWVEAVLDAQTGNRKLSFGSNPLYLNQSKFIELASTITGLSQEVSKAIIADLTFNSASFHTSVSIQPFVLSSSGNYYILPNLFSQLEPSRMILGAINKSGKKKIYDKLINSIEKFNLNKLYTSVCRINGWTCYLEKTLKANGKTICPDLILIAPDKKEVYVIDYKHFIGPITASEVDCKMIEVNKGIEQLKNYVAALNMIDKIGKTDITGFKVQSLMITHKPLPVPIPAGNDLPIIDSASFLELIKPIETTDHSLNDLLLLEAQNVGKAFTEFNAEIKVGDWKIVRRQHKIG